MRSLAPMFVALAVSLPTAAFAQDFKRTQTCNITGAINACGPGEVPRPIAWPRACVRYRVNENGSADLGAPDALDPATLLATQLGFGVWTEPETTRFEYVYDGTTALDRAEWTDSSADANIVVWLRTWPAEFSASAYAITSVNYNPETARILDADIELNDEIYRFTASDQAVQLDVQNTMAHEAGHFLGLDHVNEQRATMYGNGDEGEVLKRDLAPGDIAGVSAIYPADGTDPCDPRVGGLVEPRGAVDDGCCSSVRSRPLHTPVLPLLVLLGLFTLRSGSTRSRRAQRPDRPTPS